ncbi:MAG: hypothetical protein WB760_28890 [Xanthobacteraceae bacterium]
MSRQRLWHYDEYVVASALTHAINQIRKIPNLTAGDVAAIDREISDALVETGKWRYCR